MTQSVEIAELRAALERIAEEASNGSAAFADTIHKIAQDALNRGARVSERPAPDYKKMLEDLAEAAVGYLNAQAHVGVTEDDLRRLNYQLGCLAGPHLKAYTAGSPPQTESTEP
jgi:uncharacterized protein YhaN